MKAIKKFLSILIVFGVLFPSLFSVSAQPAQEASSVWRSIFTVGEVAAQGPPTLPSSFWGTVKVNGQNVPDGTRVSALINGTEYGSALTSMHEGQSFYSLNVLGDNPSTPDVEGGKQGDTVQFKIGALVADQTGTWNMGTVVRINLTATDDGPVFQFNDVPDGYWAEDYIYRLYASGITVGCSQIPPLYCPELNVTRAEMAVFLERGINEPGYLPPQGTGTLFADVPISYWAVNWIEQLYDDGITVGCDTNPLRYCPDQSVTRAEMAAFLLRSKYGAGYTPPKATIPPFNDVPLAHWAVDWIAQLKLEGITTGFATGFYNPEGLVTRAEMAAFLVRTFELPELP